MVDFYEVGGGMIGITVTDGRGGHICLLFVSILLS